MKNPEILAPAGSLETLYAVIEMGADAVYVGACQFGARAFADNPSEEELVRAITDCHIRGKKLYLTVNTLLTDPELEEELLPLMEPLVKAGLDAAIVQDPGVMIRLHEAYPALPLHASTQMALFSGEEAELLSGYGVTRFVPARELTIGEIAAARAGTDIEIEVFVHGALCVCYSGWCLMSEHIGGRSGNRGMCAGPCRLPYTVDNRVTNYLNAKDSETLLYIPELIKAGVDSFKIEGRMKSKEYASFMAYLYRHYADVYLEEGEDYYRNLIGDPESGLHRDRKRAMDLYNRGGFFPSFLFWKQDAPDAEDERSGARDNRTIEYLVRGHFGIPAGKVVRVNRSRIVKETTAEILLTEAIHPQDVLAVRDQSGRTVYEFTVSGTHRPREGEYTVPVGHSEVNPGDEVFRTKNPALLSEIDGMIKKAAEEHKIVLRGHLIARIGTKTEFTITGEGCEVTVFGDVLQRAEKHPISKEDIRKRLAQLGNSPYVFEKLRIDLDEEAFLPLRSIKSLRREAIGRWERELTGIKAEIRDPIRPKKAKETEVPGEEKIWIRVLTYEQWSAVADYLTGYGKGKSKSKPVVLLAALEGIPFEAWEGIRDTDLSETIKAFSIPRAFRGRDKERFIDHWKRFAGTDPVTWPGTVFMANSMASIVFRNKYLPGITTYADENLYMTNHAAESFYQSLSVRPGPVRRYGRIPVMTSAHRLTEQSPESGGEIIRTPKGDRFIVCRPHACSYCMVYTAEPVFDKQGNLINFTTETAEEVREVLKKWLS